MTAEIVLSATWLSGLCVYCSGRSLRFKRLRFCAVYARTFSWCGLVMRMIEEVLLLGSSGSIEAHIFWLQVQEVLELDLCNPLPLRTTLLTGEKPVSLARSPEVGGLVAYFNFSMEENRLFDIVDAQVKVEGITEDILAVATLAKRCLDLSGRRRPTMKEVAMELEWIQKSVKASNKLQQNQEEVEYVRNEVNCDCPWDVASESTGSGFDGGTASSKDSLPLLSY